MKKRILVGIISSLGLLASLTGCEQAGSSSRANVGDQYVTGISLNFERYNFENAGETISLVATVSVKEGKEYTGGITWKTSASVIASITEDAQDEKNCLVTALSGGECYISAIAGYKLATCKITVPKTNEPVGDLTLSISQTQVSIKPNSNVQLYSYLDGNEVTGSATWTSSNESVATVSGGLVTGLSVGTAIISSSYSSKTVTCEVNVSEDAVMEFTITLNRSSITLLENATTTLVATTTEPAEVSWVSSDESVATVNDGVVRALHEGSAIITASSNGKSATCTVTVNKPSEEEEDEDKCVLVRFFIDYNNVNDDGMVCEPFFWYQNVPLISSPDVPEDPTEPRDPAFPYFIGWSTHTLIDDKSDLWNMETDYVDGTVYTLTLYGIWLDVEA